jgi:Leucine-rich repeat (LRR) protein
LKYLNLHGNKIATLPASIGQLTALKTLYDNILAAVPASIGSLTALTALALGNNRLATLPDWIGGMTTLTKLSLGGNQLARLPDAIGQLAGLRNPFLNGKRNQLSALSALPESIVALTNLTSLALYDNPLSIRSAQSAAVQAWLRIVSGGAGGNLRYNYDSLAESVLPFHNIIKIRPPRPRLQPPLTPRRRVRRSARRT